MISLATFKARQSCASTTTLETIMAVMKTHISWTDSTWNNSVGCTKISAGCDNCYAEVIVKRFGRHEFEDIQLHHNRLHQVAAFKPLVKDGEIVPRMVFVNSMSDAFHESIDNGFRHKVFDAMATMPNTIFQLLTKRPGVAQRFLRERFGDSGESPSNLWFGVSIENNDVKKRIEVLRAMKARHNISCAFLSVEPLIGPVDECDFTDMDWVLIGGESGPKCRPMDISWLRGAVEQSKAAKAAIWFKQYGHDRNHPAVQLIMQEEGLGMRAAFAESVKRGIELEPDEKGGATLDGKVYHELPKAWHDLKAQLASGAGSMPSAKNKKPDLVGAAAQQSLI
jgi:protein gp37